MEQNPTYDRNIKLKVTRMLSEDRYARLTKISEGGFADVYVGTRREDSETIVVKKLKEQYLQVPEKRVTMENEIKFLRKLHHPSIPQFFDSYESTKEYSVAMEYIPGVTLSKLLNTLKTSRSFLPPEFLFEIFDRLTVSLEYLHNYEDTGQVLLPIIHCDIKPKNILITRDLRVALVDFSVAMHHGSGSKTIGGTYRYMPAEIYAGYSPTPQSDLFAAMLVFYEMLMLRSLVTVRTVGEVFAYLLSGKHLEQIRGLGLAKPLQSLLLKGLAVRPEDRFTTADEMANAAKECADSLGIANERQDLQHFLANLSLPGL